MNEKIKIKEAIIVEGKYDVNTIKQIFDGVVIQTNGFRIYKDKEKLALLRRMAETCGILVLTDSDGAGFQIRGHLKGSVGGRVIHAYIPNIPGKERRKVHPSKDGTLGVEGMRRDVILEAVRRAGATIGSAAVMEKEKTAITKADMYEDGFFGGENSTKRRECLQMMAGLPQRMSANALLEAINSFYGRDGYELLKKQL